MKTIKLIAIALLLSIGAVSCSSDEDPHQIEKDPMTGFNLLTGINANGHTVELYSQGDHFITGYNEIYIRIKDNADDSYFPDVEITWLPVMKMIGMAHSCPRSTVMLTDHHTISKGFIIFQMAGTEEEYWELSLNYRVGGQEYSSTTKIAVKMPADQKQRITAFMGDDGVRYVLAMVSPQEPKVGVNDMQALLYRMENAMVFSGVRNYKITLDPRMPGMGNHGSPNNTDLSYDADSGSYNGKLNLSMTGYWKLNLKLMNGTGEVLKGEDVTEEREASSLFFELEF
ncbi:MAG TPA: hypothetical protein VLZ54_02480 [Arenibacter sp.]|nr:hypothetical protein [Arenibacter sp.]